ncbi:MAG: hypothetical protein ABL967_15900 [Bryobacteraceae bacterium]
MPEKVLPQVTADLEKQLGPCVLVLRCHELLGDQPEETRRLAERIVLRELQNLSSMIRQAPGAASTAEQFLRTIYSLQMARRSSEALSAYQRFVSTFRKAAPATTIPIGAAFRIAVSTVILDRRDPEILNILSENSLPWRLSRAWASENADLLEEIFAEIEDAVLDQEDADRLHPWDDTWHYILLSRLERRLECPSGVPGV